MRRLFSGLGVMLLAGGLTAVAGMSPAKAECPAGEGTLPGSSNTVTPIGTDDGTQYTTVYVDDRDFTDSDDNSSVAGGLWLYVETNKTRGLQRGGDHVVFTLHPALNPNVPRVEPIRVLPAGGGVGLPVPARDVILFPNGIGGGSLSELAGFHDDCKTDARNNQVWTGAADSILF